MTRGPAPVARNAVQTALLQAGRTGIRCEDIARATGLIASTIKTQIYRLRAHHGMQITMRREQGCKCRFWASPELAGEPAHNPKRVRAPSEAQLRARAARPPTKTRRMLEWLAEHPQGATSQQLADALGLTEKHVSSLLSSMARRQEVVGRPAPEGKAVRRLRYYLPQHAPAARPARQARPIARAGSSPIWANAPVDSRGVVPTVIPHGTDHRFTVREVTPMFSAMAPGSYLPDDTWASRAYG